MGAGGDGTSPVWARDSEAVDVPATVYLGQYTWEEAEAIAGRLETAGIGWWHKQAGPLTRWLSAADWGVRLFVVEDRLEDARGIAAEVTAADG